MSAVCTFLVAATAACLVQLAPAHQEYSNKREVRGGRYDKKMMRVSPVSEFWDLKGEQNP